MVTSIKQTLVLKGHLFSCPVIEKVIRIELLLRGHLFYKATFSLSQRWPLNTGLTVFTLYLNSKKEVFNMQEVWHSTNTLHTMSQSVWFFVLWFDTPIFFFAHSRFDSKIICFNTFSYKLFEFPLWLAKWYEV